MENGFGTYPLHCWLLGSAGHGNLGDHQITESMAEFLRELQPDLVIHEVSAREYFQRKRFLRDIILPDDVLLFPGGGNLGTLWPQEERLRQDALATWPENPKLIFPQSVFFSEDEEGERALEESRRIYWGENCLLALRDPVSYELARENFSCRLFLTPDISLYSKPAAPENDRSGCLLVLRGDKESQLSDGEQREIEAVVRARFGAVHRGDTILGHRVRKEQRRQELEALYAQIRSMQLVVTDRLHGMLLSAITGTPCVLFANGYHKNRASMQWVEDLPYIRLAERAEDLVSAIDALDLTKTYFYPQEAKRELFREFRTAVAQMLEKSRKPVQEEEPKVSVVIPVYNVEPWLDECMASVTGQSLREIEIICVNDGSTDASRSILEKYADRDPRIVIIDQENRGISAARNAGLDRAHGKYLYFLDSDDFIEPQTLEHLYDRMQEQQLEMLFFDTRVFVDTPDLAELAKRDSDYFTRKAAYPEIYSGNELFRLFTNHRDYIAPVFGYMSRNSWIGEHGFRFLEGIYHEDELYTFQCITAARRVAYLPEPLYNRRVRMNSIMTMERTFQHVYGCFACASAMADYVQTIDRAGEFTELYADEVEYLLNTGRRRFDELSEQEKAKYKELPADEAAAFYALILCGSRQRLQAKKIQEEARQYRRMMAPFTARIDAKLAVSQGEGKLTILSVSDENAIVSRPARLQKKGEGFSVESAALFCEIRLRCGADGELKLNLGGIDLRDGEGKQVPAWIDYSVCAVNGTDYLDGITPAWKDRPKRIKLPVTEGKQLDIRLGWDRHREGAQLKLSIRLWRKVKRRVRRWLRQLHGR